MYEVISAEQAVNLVQDGDFVAVNSFLMLANPFRLHEALAERFRQTGHPKGLTYFSAAGFGGWDENLLGDLPVVAGAVRKVIASHFRSMPGVIRLAQANQIECYCLPLGVLSHAIRAAAAGRKEYFSKIGRNIFVDPRLDGPAMNEISTEQMVRLVEIDGEEYLAYKTPQIDVAFIKGTTADGNGNISFEHEPVTLDALALAQATRANGGKVIVQVDRLSDTFARPRNVIIPGALVDAVVVCDEIPANMQTLPSLSGDIHVHPKHMDYWMSKLDVSGKRAQESADQSSDIIGMRAAQELRAEDIVNIGIGIPEKVGKNAAGMGILKDLTLTVEAGGFGGLPAPGISFGATIGSDMICDMSAQFDFYDGGGLDICFMGAIEVDRQGNVNAHRFADSYSGIGGFANITAATRKIVFCLNFTTKGLRVSKKDDGVSIDAEGHILKFKKDISAVSFSAENALALGQKVLYVTERCVFELTEDGLRLKEVFDGVDEQTQIRDLLDFPLA